MSRAEYNAALADDPAASRCSEHAAMIKLIDLLGAAGAPTASPRMGAIAAYNLNAVWSALIEDLASPANDLATEIKAKLISIGIHMISKADEIRLGRKPDLEPLREIHQIIADGLK